MVRKVVKIVQSQLFLSHHHETYDIREHGFNITTKFRSLLGYVK